MEGQQKVLKAASQCKAAKLVQNIIKKSIVCITWQKMLQSIVLLVRKLQEKTFG